MCPNVLVADDSSTMRKIIIRSLQAIGVASATEAKDGEEAISLFKQGGFDMVLTDWNMPGKTGLDVIREIRVAEYNRSHHHDHYRGGKTPRLGSNPSRRIRLHH